MIKKENRKWWMLGALAIGLLAVGLDLTILNLALPTLAADLHASNRELQWFADAYNLVFAAALLPAGLLGDRLGRKKMLLAGLLLFGASSVVCAYADSSAQLIAGRALLGLGGALLVPLSMSVIPVLFSEKERPKAIGIWVMSNALGIPLGPIVGGWLLKNYAWGSVFLINIPLIIVALFAVYMLMPESRNENSPRVDIMGILASSLGLTGLTYGVIEAGEKGLGNAGALGTIIAGLLLLAGFIMWQRRAGHPLVDPSLFRSSGFTWGSILAAVVSFVMFGILFVAPQYFQAVEGADAFGAGLRLLPLVGGLLIGSQIAGRLQPRIGITFTIALGFLLLAAGLGVGATTGINQGYDFASIWISIVGLGIGFALPAAMDAAMSALSAQHSGVGSALIFAMRNVGGTMGVAILGTVLSAGYRDKLDIDGLPEQAAAAVRQSVSAGAAAAQELHSTALLASVRASFIHGMDAMLWVCGGVAAIGILLAIAFLRLQESRGEEVKSHHIGG